MSSRNNTVSSRGSRSRSARYPRLRPGPGLTTADVAAHQCGRLRRAMVELVAEYGYGAVSVTQLTRCARVSKRDFYKHFSSKEECFLATYDDIIDRSVCGILAAIDDGKDGRERLRLGFLAFADQIAENPEAARLALVEVFAVGAAAVERMLDTNRRFESLVAGALAEGSIRVPLLLVKGIVAGCSRVARARLFSRRPSQLALDGEELMEWVFTLCNDEAVRLRGLAPAAAPARSAGVAEVPPGDERALILAATERLARREGYMTLTVPRVRAAAGVSKRSFDAHFAGVADCFLATLGMLSGRVLATAEPSFFTADTWAAGVHRMIADLGHHLAGDPGFADLAFLDVFSPDPEVVRWRGEMIVKLAAMLRQQAPPALRPSTLAAEASIGAMWGVIHHFVATDRGVHLPVAAPVLSYLAIAPVLGGPAAVEAIAAEVGRGIETSSPRRLRRSVSG